MSTAVELAAVSKSFGQHMAVDKLDLSVPTGSVYGFIGPNGSGKTTTLRMILRIYYPDAGRIVVMGDAHGRVNDDRVAYLPEERGLYRKMKVRDIISFYAELKGMRNCHAKVDWWLDRFELTAWAHKKVETLSKGMTQKVQFISTVISQPELIVLDEPFSGLDPVNMEIMKDVVLELRDQGSTIILSTHDMDVAERMCDTIFMIFHGRKVLDGSLNDIQAHYGRDTIRVRLAENHQNLAQLPGVSRINNYGRYQELRVGPDTDTQAVLRNLCQRGTVEHFELASPSLHDVFVRIAGPVAEEELASHA